MTQWITRPGWPGHALAMLMGALTPLALAPYDIWPLAVLSIAALYFGLRELTPKQAACRGWAYGFGMFAAGTSWVYVSIHDYGAASPLLAGLLTLGFVAGLGLLLALLGALWARWIRRNEAPLADGLAFAAVWVAVEMFRGWVLTGFPWLYAGYSQLSGPLAGLAPIGGVWLISFVLALSAALIVNLNKLRPHRTRYLTAIALLVMPWAASLALMDHPWTATKSEPLTVAAIQGNIEQSLKWDPAQLNAQLALYRDLSFSSKRADILVWPETAIPVLRDRADGYINLMQRFARDRNSALITGVPVRETDDTGRPRYYNAITSLGEGQGTYFKQKLVPFGEYVPLQDLLRGVIAFFDLPMSDFAPGHSGQPLLMAKDYKIAPFICYEVVYPDFAASMAADSDLLLTVSNDAWFGTSIGPLQHLQMAQMRALEAGRWMIRATNNGVTVLIDPFGRVTQAVPQFTQAVLYGEVYAMDGLTPYLRWRSWPLLALMAIILGWALLAGRLGRTL